MKKLGSGKKVVVAMSGGVDSSVAAALLLDEGYEVVGCFMRLGSDDSIEAAEGHDPLACNSADSTSSGGESGGGGNHQGCCSLNDAADARLVAAVLSMPFYVLNFKKDFGRIMDYFVGEYNAGRTPNPCVRCNDWLKFGKLADYAQSIDADFVATGHYARIERRGGHARLLRGVDRHKDQSYVLFGTPSHRIERMLLPIGSLEKPETRRLAESKGLPVFDKPDSYEICFVPDNNYRGFIDRRTPDRVRNGLVKDRKGRVLGEHDGHQHFTIGQRKGLSVSLGYPIFVVDKDAATNTITIGKKKDLLSAGLTADQTNWLIEPPTKAPLACEVKIRSNTEAVPGIVRATGPETLEVLFDKPQHAVSPGQAAVCYLGDELIGGGWIREAIGKERGRHPHDSPAHRTEYQP